MMYDSEINVCEDIVTTGKTDDKNALASALENGNIEMRGGKAFVPVPMFGTEAYRSFTEIAERRLKPLMPEYAAIVRAYTDGYAKLFPSHLADDVERRCRYIFVDLVDSIVRLGQKAGSFIIPHPDSTCDVMIHKDDAVLL